MPTDAEQYATIKTQTLALLVAMTENPKPTYTIDGQTVKWAEYQTTLEDKIAWCDKMLAGEAPFEIHSYGYT